MTPSTKVTVTAITGAVVSAIIGIAEAIWPQIDIPEAAVGFTVTAIVSVLAYFWPERNPAPSAVDAMREKGLMHPSRGV